MRDYNGNPLTIEDVKKEVESGWGDLLTRLVDDLNALGWDGSVHQVKEKFGGLRFYIGAASDQVYQRIAKAEAESIHTCELCGKPGERRTDRNWWVTRCDACLAKIPTKVNTGL